MSEEEGKDYISNNMTDEQEDNKYFTMIYKLNIDEKEKQKIIKKFKEEGFPFDDEKDYKEDVIRILGKDFVKQNKNNCKIIYSKRLCYPDWKIRIQIEIFIKSELFIGTYSSNP